MAIAGMCFQAEQLLHADMQRRRARALVVDGVPVAGWRSEVRGSFGVEAALEVPRQQRVERLAEIDRR